MRATLGLTALACAISCGGLAPPAGQVAIWIDTDAIVAPSDVPALFDTLRVDVHPPGSSAPCDHCARTFAVSSTDFSRNQVAFGVPLPPNARGWRVRLRLYAQRSTLSGDLPRPLDDGTPPASVIETVIELPPVGAEGILERRVLLATDDVGLPRGTLDAPITPEVGRFTRSRVNTWPGAARVPCAGDPAPGEVCVPGGAFWMGNPAARSYFPRKDPPSSLDANNTRLVSLSPFYFDADAVTVAQMRAAGVVPERVWSGSSDGTVMEDYCNFTSSPGPRDDFPVNCVAPSTARVYCQARGADLPTEAQYEYVAGALAGRRFPWGEDPITSCDAAVFGRGGWALYHDYVSPCRTKAPPGGSVIVGSRSSDPRVDRVSLPGGDIFDLEGNVGVWTLDLWNRQTEPCWSQGGVYVDPVCTSRSVDGLHRTTRGTGWLALSPLPAAYRTYDDQANDGTGVRCARPGQ